MSAKGLHRPSLQKSATSLDVFKICGLTVTAIFLAAGVRISTVIGALTDALEASGKAIGKGLKDIESKVGFIGSVFCGSSGSLLGVVCSFRAGFDTAL